MVSTARMPSDTLLFALSIVTVACFISSLMEVICSEICRADFSDSSASLRTSEATTAKPRPCSPARAASMEAFSASRLVWREIPVITPTMP
ncbi:hypothetical protein D3C75_828400 [compost metagenome]